MHTVAGTVIVEVTVVVVVETVTVFGGGVDY